jgi:hypothetical protein
MDRAPTGWGVVSRGPQSLGSSWPFQYPRRHNAEVCSGTSQEKEEFRIAPERSPHKKSRPSGGTSFEIPLGGRRTFKRCQLLFIPDFSAFFARLSTIYYGQPRKRFIEIGR